MSGSSGEAGASALLLDRVSCRFGTRLVVEEVSFEAPRGRVTVLVGPSGCGKTTLLRMIAGVERPSSGRVLVDGNVVAGPADFVPPERRRVGLMFQDYALFPHLTVRDNVLFGLGHLPRAARSPVADEAIARVGLARHADRRPAQLSGGEQQRLALARALAPSPRILLMDEPFSNLDRNLRDEVRAGTLAVLRQAAVTALVVTHDPEEALAIGDHLVLLDQGRVIQAGPAEAVYARPASPIAARALSGVTLVCGRFEGGALHTPLGALPAAEGRTGEDGVACIRPEHIRVASDGEGRPGRIEARMFQGASTLLTVSVTGMADALRILVPTHRVPRDDVVAIVVEPGGAIVFPAAGGRLDSAAQER